MNGRGPEDRLNERPGEPEIARLREAFAVDSGRPAPERCLDPERIWDALDGALGPEELRAVVDHLADCPDCAEEWRLAAAFRQEAADEETEERSAPDLTPVAPRGRRTQIHSWLAAAAVAVLALGTAGVWWSTRPGTIGTVEAPVYRQATEQQIESLLPEDRPLPRDEPVLRWTPGPEGSTYDVLVSTEDLTPVADASGLTEPSFEIPADALGNLPAGAEILWQVEATTPDGKRIASPTFVNRME